MQVVFSPGAEIKFEGANNFRELGGYRAADGRQVKYGLLYRGGNLDLLKSEADHARLASLGLREILDLRSAGESAAHPDPAVPGAHYQRVCGMRNADGTEMDFSGQGIERLRQEKEAFERSVGRPVHDFEWFSALYREMPFRNPAYHALFALLEGRRVPVLFHCSCGKDRTGIGAMLILLALGVCSGYTAAHAQDACEPPEPREVSQPSPVDDMPQEPAEQPAEDYSSLDRLELIGTFTATAYCPCVKCCGIWSEDHPSRGEDYVQKTRAGTIPEEGRTIAADWDVLPKGSEVVINGHPYTAKWGYSLFGHDVYVSQSMPDMAAGKRAVLYLDPTGLAVKVAENPSVQVLREKFADEHAVGVICWMEVDSKVENKQKIAVLDMKAAVSPGG